MIHIPSLHMCLDADLLTSLCATDQRLSRQQQQYAQGNLREMTPKGVCLSSTFWSIHFGHIIGFNESAMSGHSNLMR